MNWWSELTARNGHVIRENGDNKKYSKLILQMERRMNKAYIIDKTCVRSKALIIRKLERDKDPTRKDRKTFRKLPKCLIQNVFSLFQNCDIDQGYAADVIRQIDAYRKRHKSIQDRLVKKHNELIESHLQCQVLEQVLSTLNPLIYSTVQHSVPQDHVDEFLIIKHLLSDEFAMECHWAMTSVDCTRVRSVIEKCVFKISDLSLERDQLSHSIEDLLRELEQFPVEPLLTFTAPRHKEICPTQPGLSR